MRVCVHACMHVCVASETVKPIYTPRLLILCLHRLSAFRKPKVSSVFRACLGLSRLTMQDGDLVAEDQHCGTECGEDDAVRADHHRL